MEGWNEWKALLEYKVPGTGHDSANGGVLLPSVWNRVLSHRFSLLMCLL